MTTGVAHQGTARRRTGRRAGRGARRGLGGWLLGGLLALAAARAASAQEVGVRAQVDRSRVSERDQVVLSVEVSAASLDQVGPPDIAALGDFEIISGPAVSSRFQWINGRTSASKSFSYVLRPKGIGTRTIPALGLLVQGKTYRTQPIDVEVVPGGGGVPAPGGPPAGGPRGGPGRPQVPIRPQTGPGPADVRVRAEVDTRTAYVGQQITARFLLDTQTEVLNLGLKDNPNFPGFWAEDIKVPENLEMKRVELGAQPYTEYTLMKKALFPTSAGSLTIPGVAYQIQVRRRGQDPIESFFFTPTETLQRRTEPVTINVVPLPAASRPPGFSGAVGSFTLQVSADRKESQVNDAIGVKVRIAGEGNMNAVSVSPLPELGDFKQYPPRTSASSSLQGERLRGEKVWDYVLIPLAPGTQQIPPVTFSFFDPRDGEYRSVSSAPIAIQVARGSDQGGATLPVVSQSDVRALGRDIHYIKLAPDGLADRSRPFYRAPLFAVLLLLPIVADAGIFALTRRREALQANARQRRERRARSQARKRLKEARRRMAPASSRAFYAAVAGALSQYAADKFDTAAAGLTHDRIEELLASRGVAETLRSEFHRCLEACDYARFAPASSNQAEMQRTLEAAEEVLVALERSISA